MHWSVYSFPLLPFLLPVLDEDLLLVGWVVRLLDQSWFEIENLSGYVSVHTQSVDSLNRFVTKLTKESESSSSYCVVCWYVTRASIRQTVSH